MCLSAGERQGGVKLSTSEAALFSLAALPCVSLFAMRVIIDKLEAPPPHALSRDDIKVLLLLVQNWHLTLFNAVHLRAMLPGKAHKITSYNNRLLPRTIAQRTSELNSNLRGYSRFLYRCRCDERLREELAHRIGHTLFRYVPSRTKHPAYR